MSGHGAFEEEMLFRTLSDQDVERLLLGQAPGGGEFAPVADFARALRQTLPGMPAQDEGAFVAQLAETARAASLASEAKTTPLAPVRPTRRRRSLPPPRFATLARVTAALAVVPLLFAGLAVAGVTLPEPARNAFETLGLELPNQPADDDQGEKAGDAGKAGGGASDQQGNETSAAKGHHGQAKSNPAREGGRGNGRRGKGRVLGKKDLAPGQVLPPGQLNEGLQGKALGQSNNPPVQSSKPATPPKGSKAQGRRSAGSAHPAKPAKPAKPLQAATGRKS